MPDEWGRRLLNWSRLHQHLKWAIEDDARPDPNEEMLIYQTLLGIWPLQQQEMQTLGDRLKAYVIKAGREAKVHTNWLSPNEEHEAALTSFIEGSLDEKLSATFLADFREFQEKIAFHGALNSLTQTLLKMTSPGVPDFYQGTMVWDFSLVDPDNRRPVDFLARLRLLEGLEQEAAADRPGLLSRLLDDWRSGAIKMYTIAAGLRSRNENRGIFERGDYLPLVASGSRRPNVIAYARRLEGRWIIAAAPRLTSQLCAHGRWPLGREVWRDDWLRLPEGAPRTWRDVYTDSLTKAEEQPMRLPLGDVFAGFPVALMESVDDATRRV
jgi:(1->4)-alpha-D-glucan 1-alpha-D-glucosylmutase